MPAANPTVTIYPEPTARAVVGWNSPACNLAILRWARVLRAAERDLPAWSWRQWCYIADAMNATAADSLLLDHASSASMLCAELEDAHRLNAAGEKWFGPADAERRIRELLAQVGEMDYAHIACILTAVEWFWGHHEGIDAEADPWWTVEYRCRHHARE